MSIRSLYDTLDYGPAPESPKPALDWIARHDGRFGHFIAGRFTAPGEGFATHNPATGDVLATISRGNAADVAAAVRAARRAQAGWARLGAHVRARHLYALARGVQKHARLLAVLETLDTGKPIREARDIDIPLVARHFHYHAGLAQILPDEAPGMVPHGVCGAVIPWNFPLLMLAWKVAPALATGNTVVLKPAEWTPLSALCLAQIARETGLPAGVLNIVTGDGTTGAALVTAEVDKVAFTGSTEVGREIRRATAGTGKALTLELGGKSPFIVFDDADLDSAAEGVVDSIWFNGGQVCCAGSRLLVSEGVAESFHHRLRARMARLRVGNPLDKAIDMGAIVDPAHRARIAALVDGCTEGRVHQNSAQVPPGCYYPPTLIENLPASNPLMHEEIFGPVLVSTTFRTPAEAVALANDTTYGLAASVWSENINLALGVAPQIRAGVIWVNAANLFDAAAGFGGVRCSGFGREGGREGVFEYLRAAIVPRMARPLPPALPRALPYASPSAPPSASLGALPGAEAPAALPAVDRTAKFYIGGKQVRPDGGTSACVYGARGALIGQVGIGNRKDIRNAVEAARATQPAWAAMGGAARAQVIHFIAENLSARGTEFADRLRAMTGATATAAAAEVEATIETLFRWGAWADKADGAAKPVPIRGIALAINAPVGVIGMLADDRVPLLGAAALIGPAIAMGNACVLVPSRAHPLIVSDFQQVLDTSDVPGGVVNIVAGGAAELADTLARHLDVDAVWSFAGADVAAAVERASVGNLKRTLVCHGRAIDWATPDSRAWVRAATEVRTIWVPWGE
jgi:aldehyde dehydrogenase (NAD+)